MHVAVIMDGNGRWAKKRGKQRLTGHRQGAKAARICVEAAIENKVATLSLFAFSSENWQRSKVEVTGLMRLFLDAIKQNESLFHKHHIRFFSIGDRSAFSKPLREAIIQLEKATKDYKRLNLVIAANYGGRWDIENAHTLSLKNQSNEIVPYLALNKLDIKAPDVDLMIRTGGEKRISNFLLWNLAYSELYFTDSLWPDFNKTEFSKAMVFFHSRTRKFGKV